MSKEKSDNIVNMGELYLTMIFFLAPIYILPFYFSTPMFYLITLISGAFIWIFGISRFYKQQEFDFHPIHIVNFLMIGVGYYFSMQFIRWQTSTGILYTIIAISGCFYAYSLLTRSYKFS